MDDLKSKLESQTDGLADLFKPYLPKVTLIMENHLKKVFMENHPLLKKKREEKFSKSVVYHRRQNRQSEDSMKEEDKYFKLVMNSNNDSEIMVKTCFGEATRKQLKFLQPDTFISDLVLDLAAKYLTHLQNDVFYVPNIAKILKEDTKFFSKSIASGDMLECGSGYKKFYFPIIVENHWFLNVVDLEKKQIFVLDSVGVSESRQTVAKEQIAKVVNLLSKLDGYQDFQKIVEFGSTQVDVPRQVNGSNCGFHVLKWIAAYHVLKWISF